MAPPLLEVPWTSTITFALNDRRVTLQNPSPSMKLIEYLRDVAHLTGTKLSCGEGGCGACTVVLCHRPLDTQFSDAGGQDETNDAVVYRAVNACLFPVCALDGVQVFTVEALGSTTRGLHAVQKRLVDASGSQCGFCTPGWVMNMYELLKTTSNQRSKQQIEDHFDGNLCRCTGYRPILEAFHSFAGDKKDEDAPAPQTLAYEQPETTNATATVLESCEYLEDWLLVDDVEEGKKSICEAKCGHDKAHSCSSKLAELEELHIGRCQATLAANAPYDVKNDPKPADFIINFTPKPIKISELDTDGSSMRIWYRPLNLDHLSSIFQETCNASVGFVGGRTAHGISKYYNSSAPYNRSTEHRVQVEVNYIAELKQTVTKDNHVVIGAAVTINTLLSFLKKFDEDDSAFQELATLVQRVANNQVRNSATWAGNVSFCRQHPSFVSDLVVGLMGIGAVLTVADMKLQRKELEIDGYLSLPRDDFYMIISMQLPRTPSASQLDQSSKRQQLSCYKVAQRPQNAHSHVNCAVWILSRTDQTPRSCIDVRVVFGGVCKRPSRFTSTEAFLKGRDITPDTMTQSLEYLEKDLTRIGASEAFGSAPSRLSVMRNLLFKSVLSSMGKDAIADPTVTSASTKLSRKVSSGIESFKPNDSTTPVSKPIAKIGAKLQVTGEAAYTVDKELPSSALYGAILYSRRALATLISIDKTNQVRKMEGVVGIVTARDIPGVNDISSGAKEEPLFVPVGEVVRCVGAPIALIVATSANVAELAVAMCEVEYGQVPSDKLWHGQSDGTPILDIDQAIKANTLGAQDPIKMGDDNVNDKLKTSKNKLNGSLLLGAQKHFYMEPQVSVASPQEGGVVLVESSTQFPTFMQQQVAAVLGVKYNAVTVQVQRAGGGFGGKLTRCVVNAAAAAVASMVYGTVVRVLNDRSADFRLVGGRENMRGTYNVGFDDDGYIQALDLRLDVDCGYNVGDSAGSAAMAVQWADSAYRTPSFRCQAYLYLTNTQTCTSLRAPGVPQSLVLYEAAMHHVAEYLNLPMRWVQERNLYKEGDHTPFDQVLKNVRFHEVWDRLVVSSSINQREEAIVLFNSNNKWKKRGIAMTPTKYGMTYSGRKDGSRVEIFAGDGSVILTHGGCEIGQGIHTKAAQVCAYELGISMDLIKVRPTSTDQVSNSEATGGSSTSESVAQSVIACCKQLNDRLKDYRQKNPHKSWQEIVQDADADGVCLFAGAQPAKKLPKGDMFDYFVYAAACSEVEVDVLTGEINIKSAELVYDCGISLNPAVDIGQIEGGFIMGVGLYLEEDVVYVNKNNGSGDSGDLLTQGTWEYKVPCVKDIPEKFNVTLLENANNKSGVLNSKATGEPPYALATSVYFAVKKALMDSRRERGVDGFLQLDVPATVMRRQDAAVVQAKDFVW